MNRVSDILIKIFPQVLDNFDVIFSSRKYFEKKNSNQTFESIENYPER